MAFSTEDFKAYRRALGFTNQQSLKAFLGAKDITAPIDYSYVDHLDVRLVEMVEKINGAVDPTIRISDLAAFTRDYVQDAHQIIVESGILQRMNNRGRRPEEVYFSWMRGSVIAHLFRPALLKIFNVGDLRFNSLGKDNLRDPNTFSRTATADFSVRLGADNVRVEVQAGFQGVNDIKKHKIEEAWSIFKTQNEPSVVVHFDFFNGQVAFLRIDQIPPEDVHWITREQMEGQSVYNIDQNSFTWLLTQEPPHLAELAMIPLPL